MAKTKIVVFQMKELIYTAIFAGLGILLIVLLVFMFAPSGSRKETSSDASDGIYTPGVYTSQVALGDNTLNLEVTVDTDQIKSVNIVNLEESVATMYPLVETSIESIEEELIAGTSPEDITLSEKSKYTESLLIEGVRIALDKALSDQI